MGEELNVHALLRGIWLASALLFAGFGVAAVARRRPGMVVVALMWVGAISLVASTIGLWVVIL